MNPTKLWIKLKIFVIKNSNQKIFKSSKMELIKELIFEKIIRMNLLFYL